jgi:hypothetical protein
MNICVSNCLIYENHGCLIKIRCGPCSRFENIPFSNLVMTDVTGPISIGVGRRQHRSNGGSFNTQTNLSASSETHTEPAATLPAGIVRHISFMGFEPP